MLIIILTTWLIGIALILIFFRGATRKEREMEMKRAVDSIKHNIR